MRKASHLLLSAIAAAASALATGQAAAAPADEVAVSVRVADLDLSTEAGQARLTRRVAYAAGTACSSPDTRGLQATSEYNACKAAALSDARAKARRMIAAATEGGTAVQTASRR